MDNKKDKSRSKDYTEKPYNGVDIPSKGDG